MRFVRFAADEKQETTLRLLAECFEVLGGVPAVVLTDRMGCLKGGVVANRVVPTPHLVRFATHYRFRPDFCEAHDPESKGLVENLVGYGKDDLLRPLMREHALHQRHESVSINESVVTATVLADLPAANARAAEWCAQVNAAVHSETCVVPAERLIRERELLSPLPSLRPSIGPPPVTRKVDKLSSDSGIRLGSARYSVPSVLRGAIVAVVADGPHVAILNPATGEVHAQHPLVAPGEASILNAHYGGPRPAPRRSVRPKTAAEKQFCALGPAAEAFITCPSARRRGRAHPPRTRADRAQHDGPSTTRPRRERVHCRARAGHRVRAVARRGHPVHPRRRGRHASTSARRQRPRHRPPRDPRSSAERVHTRVPA